VPGVRPGARDATRYRFEWFSSPKASTGWEGLPEQKVEVFSPKKTSSPTDGLPAFQGPKQELTRTGTWGILRPPPTLLIPPRDLQFAGGKFKIEFAQKLKELGGLKPTKEIVFFFIIHHLSLSPQASSVHLAADFSPSLATGPQELTSPREETRQPPNQVFFENNPSSATSNLPASHTQSLSHTFTQHFRIYPRINLERRFFSIDITRDKDLD
jgi:hypothetical protein